VFGCSRRSSEERRNVKRKIVLLGAVAASIGAIGAAGAAATTGVGYQFVIGVRLTDSGVAFTRQQHVPRGSVVEFLITNLSHKARRFNIGGRQTRLLKPRAHETFFVGFTRRGTFHYRSFGSGARTFAGTFTVN
jgi:hypothetical protein